MATSSDSGSGEFRMDVDGQVRAADILANLMNITSRSPITQEIVLIGSRSDVKFGRYSPSVHGAGTFRACWDFG